MVRPRKARIESSTNPASLSVSVWIATCTSCSSATESAQSIAAGVVPQSSWSLSPIAPAAICSRRGSGAEALPFPRKPRLTGNASAASSIRWTFHDPDVDVVALVPVAGPAPPPAIIVGPARSPPQTGCGQMEGGCVSSPPPGVIFPSPASPPLPSHGEVAVDADQELGGGETPAVAGRRTVEIGVLTPCQAQAHGRRFSHAASRASACSLSAPSVSALSPKTRRAPASSTSVTRFSSPGSKRTAVPAGPVGGQPEPPGAGERGGPVPPQKGEGGAAFSGPGSPVAP